MVRAVQCPQCGGAIGVADEDAGHRVECPLCSARFDVPAAPPPEAEDDRWRHEEDEIARRRYRRARQAVAAPATALQVLGWIGVAFAVIEFLVAVTIPAALADVLANQPGPPAVQKKPRPPNPGPPDPAAQRQQVAGSVALLLSSGTVCLVCSVLTLSAAGRMKRLRQYGYAVAAASLAMVPCALPCLSPCALIGLPFGVWALVVLADPPVRREFAKRREELW